MNHSFSKVSVIGLGYIGLPTAAVFASCGIKVLGVDINKDVVDRINRGEIHIIEPNLENIVCKVVESGNLRAATSPETSDAFIIAVPTPFKNGNVPDITYVESAARSIAPFLEKGCLVIIESTSPVGTTDQIVALLSKERPDLSFPDFADLNPSDVSVAYCPERVLPGNAIHELAYNDRVIGGVTDRCTRRASELYQVFLKANCLPTNARTAEMVKLTENSFRDVNIAFANELSIICDKLNIDVWSLIKLANHHPRVDILKPGPGVGGHCIAVDPWFIVHSAPIEAKLIRTAREVNNSKPHWVVDKVIEVSKLINKRPVISCLGLTFKADIDDLRESPALEIALNLSRENIGQLLIVEPHISDLPDSLMVNDTKLVKIDEAIQKADVLLVLVDHKIFSELIKMDLRGKKIIDTRGILLSR